jgi:hypothetical protein
MLVSPGLCSPGMSLTNPRDPFRRFDARRLTKDERRSYLALQPDGRRDGETVTPSLPEPGMWTGMAQANVWAPLTWKRAKIHRGSRRRILGPHQEAGYTSAVVTVAPHPVSRTGCNRCGVWLGWIFAGPLPGRQRGYRTFAQGKDWP